MKRCVSLLALLTSVLALSGCASMKLTVRRESPPASAAQTERTYASFWDAVDNADFAYAMRQNLSTEQKEFASAMQSALNGSTDEAVETIRKAWMSTSDSTTRHRSRELLENLLFARSRWKEILDVYAQDTAAVDPTEDTRPLVKVFAAAPEVSFQLPAVPDTIPIRLNGVGLPVAEVAVNGHKKRFLLDTGAALTVLSSDFARECGIAAAKDNAVAGTSNTKTVKIQGAVADSVRVGKLLIRNHPVAIIESSHLRFRLFGLITLMKIDGIIGWNAIREMNLKINYRDKYVVVQSPQERKAVPRNLFDLGEPMVVLTDEHGTRFNFLLDTGSNLTSLGQNTLSKINAQRLRKRMTIVGGAGGMESFNAAVVPHLTLYTNNYVLEFKNLRTHPESKGEVIKRDGILGSDVAQRGAITIDYQNGYFEFQEITKQHR